MRKLFVKAWFRWLLAGAIAGAFVLWLAVNGVAPTGVAGWFR
ncbi:MAG: hypothetical protein NXH88_01905 [Hyphomonas sp.]|nr:hypothetical protein [Hyphomonas sp.]